LFCVTTTLLLELPQQYGLQTQRLPTTTHPSLAAELMAAILIFTLLRVQILPFGLMPYRE
jgi:hypothetical protein